MSESEFPATEESVPRSARPLVDQLPARWNAMEADNTFWISCYRVVFGDPADLGEDGYSLVELTDATVLVVNGAPIYQFVSPLEIVSSTPDRTITMSPLVVEQRTLNPGLYLRIVMPYTTFASPGNDAVVRKRVEEIAGLAIIELGQGALFVHLFDNIFSFAKNQISVSTTAFKTPGGRLPSINASSLAELGNADKALGALPISDQSRLQLGLRWYGDSFVKDGDIDRFLAIWFALETIGMTTTNIRGLNQLLSAAYAVSERLATKEFQIGKIFRMRGDIVHDGARPAIHADLLAFVQAIFLDVFRHLLGQLPWGFARRAIAEATEPPEKWFPNYLRP